MCTFNLIKLLFEQRPMYISGPLKAFVNDDDNGGPLKLLQHISFMTDK